MPLGFVFALEFFIANLAMKWLCRLVGSKIQESAPKLIGEGAFSTLDHGEYQISLAVLDNMNRQRFLRVHFGVFCDGHTWR